MAELYSSMFREACKLSDSSLIARSRRSAMTLRVVFRVKLNSPRNFLGSHLSVPLRKSVSNIGVQYPIRSNRSRDIRNYCCPNETPREEATYSCGSILTRGLRGRWSRKGIDRRLGRREYLTLPSLRLVPNQPKSRRNLLRPPFRTDLDASL
jgi:hypothetical protein